MEEEILLDMYRGSWNDFLEAYKEKMDQVEKLEKIVDEYVSFLKGKGHEDTLKVVMNKLKEIKNG